MARLQDGVGDTKVGGDPARGERLSLRDTDQGGPGEGWGMRDRKKEGEEEREEERE